MVDLTLNAADAGAWVECHGQPSMAARVPRSDEDNEAKRWAHAARWIASGALTNRMTVAAYLAALAGQPLTVPGGVVIDQEMIEATDVYIEHVLACYEGAELHIEEHISIPRISAVNSGIPSLWFFHRGTLHIYQAKYGHRVAEVFENWQLINYAAGILPRLNIDPASVEVCFTIAQPRAPHPAGPIREWRISATELEPYFDRLISAATGATQGNPPLKPNKECGDCMARHTCAAVTAEAFAAVELAHSAVPFEISPEALGLEVTILRRAAAMLKARLSGLEVQASAMIKRGDRIPRLGLDQGWGRERWTVPAADVIAMGSLMKLDLAKPPEALTPAQSVNAGFPAEMRKALAETPRGEMKLVEVNDAKARRVFGRA